VIAVVATLGVIFAAYYMLPMVQRVFFNALETQANREIEDVSGRELAILAPLCALMIWIGWNPTPFLERMEPSVRAVLERVEGAAPQGTAALPRDGLGEDVGTTGAGEDPVSAEATGDLGVEAE
jgi:NADH-quinone oxidoreductase subunit M